MNWHDINNPQALTDFLKEMSYFHDSCVKEMRYFSGAYVKQNLSMWPVNDHRRLSMILQRQFKNNSVIELEFSGLVELRLRPANDQYTCEILDVTMLWKDGCIFWCDWGGLSEAEMATYDGTVICAEKIRWRSIDGYLGQEEFYTARK